MKLDQNSLHSVSVRNLCWKWNFTANFGVLSLGFDVKALIPQGLTGRPNYFGLLNNLMTLIICESLREIGEMACVTSAWSSCGQTLRCYFNFRGEMKLKPHPDWLHLGF